MNHVINADIQESHHAFDCILENPGQQSTDSGKNQHILLILQVNSIVKLNNGDKGEQPDSDGNQDTDLAYRYSYLLSAQAEDWRQLLYNPYRFHDKSSAYNYADPHL